MNRQQLLNLVNNNLPDNISRRISPYKLREIFGNYLNAYYSKEDDQLSGIVDLNDFFTKLQLQTAGQSQVHWDNITNVPALGGGITINRQILTGNLTLDETDATYQFLDPNGGNKTIEVGSSTSYKVFVIKNIGIGNYLRVDTNGWVNPYYLNENEVLGLVWDGVEWQEV